VTIAGGIGLVADIGIGVFCRIPPRQESLIDQIKPSASQAAAV